MKTKIAFSLFFFIFSFSVFAQEKTNEQMAEEMTKHMKSQIDFNDENYDKIYQINLDFVSQTAELKSDTQLGKIEKVKKLKELDENRDKQLKEVLTEEEYKKFQDNKSENKKTMKERFGQSRK